MGKSHEAEQRWLSRSFGSFDGVEKRRRSTSVRREIEEARKTRKPNGRIPEPQLYPAEQLVSKRGRESGSE